MSRIRIIDTDPNIGDSICAAPAICAFAKEFSDCEIQLWMENRDVQRIMDWPQNVFENATKEVDCQTFTISIMDAIGGGFDFDKMMHPTQHFYPLLGLEIPEEVPQPMLKVRENDSVPAYDYLIAPWSKDPVRGISPGEVASILGALKPEQPVAILGASGDGEFAFEAARVRYEYNLPLPEVVNLLRRCKKAIITGDSAINRLCHAAGVPNHVLLAGNNGMTNPAWVDHPKAFTVYTYPHEWRTADVLGAIERATAAKAELVCA